MASPSLLHHVIPLSSRTLVDMGDHTLLEQMKLLVEHLGKRNSVFGSLSGNQAGWRQSNEMDEGVSGGCYWTSQVEVCLELEHPGILPVRFPPPWSHFTAFLVFVSTVYVHVCLGARRVQCPNPSLFTMSVWDSVSHWTCSQAGGQETRVTSLPPLTIIVWLGMHGHAQIFFNVSSRGSWTPVNCHKLPHSLNLGIKARMLCHSWVIAPESC